MTESADPGSATTSVAQYLEPLVTYRRVVAGVMVATIVIGALVAALGPRSYTSTAAVLVYPVASNPAAALQAADRSTDLVTEVRIANSRTVAETTAAALQELAIAIDPDTVAANLTASNSDDSRILDLSYRSSDPGVARVGAELAAASYLQVRTELSETSGDAARAAIVADMAELQDHLAGLVQQIERAADGSAARFIAESERSSVQRSLDAQRSALADLSILAADAATVVDEPRQPESPDGLTPVQLIIGSAAGGLVLGLLAAWTLAMSDGGVGGGATGAAGTMGRGGRSRRSTSAERRVADADDPFDDTESRDPLELIRALDTMEQAEAVLTHRTRSAARKVEDEAEAERAELAAQPVLEPSFQDLYPVEYVDESDTDPDPDQSTAVPEPAPDDDQPDPPTALDADPFDASDRLAALSYLDAPSTSDEPVAAETGEATWTGDAATLPWPSEDEPDPGGVAAGAGAESGLDQLGADPPGTDPVASGPASGDPSDLDPGPASWEGPFVGPTRWDELTGSEAPAAPAGYGDARDGDVTEAGPTRADPIETAPIGGEPPTELVASDDVDALFEQLSRLGEAGPVVVLSLSDGDPAAGLTAGFELADELRALGARILLIDGRLDEPVLDSLFGDDTAVGLAQVMTGETVLRQTVRSLSGLDGLDLLTVGTPGPDTGAQLAGPTFERLLAEARLAYHSIVIIGDAVTSTDPATVAQTDRSRALAGVVDGLIVGTAQPSGTPADPHLTEVLGSLPAPVLQLTAVATALAHNGEAVAAPGM